MKRKNIVFFMPFIGIGGVEKNLFLIANHISKKKDNIYVCTSSRKCKKKFNSNIKIISPTKIFSDKVGVRIRYIYCLFVLYSFLIKNKNTLVFCFQANVYCILLCKILNIKIIVRSNTSPSGWKHNFLKEFFYKKIINLADDVVVNSIEFKNQMKKKVRINPAFIYNPLNKNEIIKKSKEKFSFNFFNNKRCLKIINVARLTEQKDHITILKSAEILKDKNINFRLLIVGSGDEGTNLKNFIKDKKLDNFVKVINSQNNPYKFINNADIFILSSKYEGLPNTLIEAALLKKFIITTNCPTGPKEITLNGKGALIFKVGDYIDLSNKIIKIKKNRKKFKNKIKSIYNSLYRFDYNINLKKYYSLVNKYT